MRFITSLSPTVLQVVIQEMSISQSKNAFEVREGGEGIGEGGGDVKGKEGYAWMKFFKFPLDFDMMNLGGLEKCFQSASIR